MACSLSLLNRGTFYDTPFCPNRYDLFVDNLDGNKMDFRFVSR
jgi:hypothetical protein